MMFAEFKLIAEVTVSAFKTLVGQQRLEWAQLANLFDQIGTTLASMATKYEGNVVPRDEFIAIQMYADELNRCWRHLPMSGKTKEMQRWQEVLNKAITTADGSDAAYFGFRSVPGPFYSRKEGPVTRNDTGADPATPSVNEIREAATIFKTAASILRTRGS